MLARYVEFDPQYCAASTKRLLYGSVCSFAGWEGLTRAEGTAGGLQPLYLPPVAHLGLRFRQRESLTLEVAYVEFK
ncbi:MAG: hypothetical protein QOH35_5987 [Acidobacteriaceae bacterium]|jgi:hypothetical protein|nr:hypothetical protein [Acidobacteriaceae bacterium]